MSVGYASLFSHTISALRKLMVANTISLTTLAFDNEDFEKIQYYCDWMYLYLILTGYSIKVQTNYITNGYFSYI